MNVSRTMVVVSSCVLICTMVITVAVETVTDYCLVHLSVMLVSILVFCRDYIVLDAVFIHSFA